MEPKIELPVTVENLIKWDYRHHDHTSGEPYSQALYQKKVYGPGKKKGPDVLRYFINVTHYVLPQHIVVQVRMKEMFEAEVYFYTPKGQAVRVMFTPKDIVAMEEFFAKTYKTMGFAPDPHND
jgi:hypothetical protein